MLTIYSRMIAISAVCMTAAHPGIYFPTISSRNRPMAAEAKQAGEKSSMSSSPGDEAVMPERV